MRKRHLMQQVGTLGIRFIQLIWTAGMLFFYVCYNVLLLLSTTQCGRAETHRINFNNISVPLLCAVRITVMNETDVDVLCPRVRYCCLFLVSLTIRHIFFDFIRIL